MTEADRQAWLAAAADGAEVRFTTGEATFRFGVPLGVDETRAHVCMRGNRHHQAFEATNVRDVRRLPLGAP